MSGAHARTRKHARWALPLLVVLALGGCGGHRATVADCLNAKGFLVEQSANVVRGSSPRGVNFTLTVYASSAAARRRFREDAPATAALLRDAVVDFAGNPPAASGRAPGRLSRDALAAIAVCVSHP